MLNLGRTIRMNSKQGAIKASNAVMNTKAAKQVSFMLVTAALKAKRVKAGLNPNKWDIPRVLALLFDILLSPIEIILIAPMQYCWFKFKNYIKFKWEGTARLKPLPNK